MQVMKASVWEKRMEFTLIGMTALPSMFAVEIGHSGSFVLQDKSSTLSLAIVTTPKMLTAKKRTNI